jgi:hypothetical protein
MAKCIICSADYEKRSFNQLTCSAECIRVHKNNARQLRRQKPKEDSLFVKHGRGYIWTPEEVALLELICDMFPPGLVTKKFNIYRPIGTPERTRKSIIHAASYNGISREPTLHYMKGRYIGSLLGVTGGALKYWVRAHNLDGYKNGHFYYFRAQSVLNFLERHPNLYQNALERSPEGLQYLSEIARSAKTLLEDLCRVRSRHDSSPSDSSASIK